MKDERVAKAMIALWNHLITLGHPFDSWPDSVKYAVTDALIDPAPLTKAEIAWAHDMLTGGKLRAEDV